MAPKPSSRHAILSFHNERVPSRSVSRRNFNTLVYLTNVRPYPLSLPRTPFSLLFSRVFAPASFSSSSASSMLRLPFRSFFLFRFTRLFARRFFVLRPYVFLFPLSFFRFPSVYTVEENSFADRGIVFLYFPAAKEEESGKTRRGCETGIGNLSSVKRALVPRPSYPERRPFDGPLVSRALARFGRDSRNANNRISDVNRNGCCNSGGRKEFLVYRAIYFFNDFCDSNLNR